MENVPVAEALLADRLAKFFKATSPVVAAADMTTLREITKWSGLRAELAAFECTALIEVVLFTFAGRATWRPKPTWRLGDLRRPPRSPTADSPSMSSMPKGALAR